MKLYLIKIRKSWFLTGAAYKNLKTAEEVEKTQGSTEGVRWGAVSDRLLIPVMEQLFTHTTR